MESVPQPPSRPPRSAARVRVMLFALATAVAGAQLAIQAHLVAHELWPTAHQVCEQCVLAKVATPLPTLAALALDVAHDAPSPTPTLGTAPLRVATIERNRGPPSSA